MHHIVQILYDLIFIPMLKLSFFFGRFFNQKIRAGYHGRKLPLCPSKKNSSKVFLVHAASLGEWEQAIPLIERIRVQWSDALIYASFFSPSGYDRAHHKAIDAKFYLPLDDQKHMQKFLSILNVDYALFSAYDVWPNMLLACKKLKIKTGLFSGTLSPASTRIKFPLQSWNKSIYNNLDFIAARSEADLFRYKHIYSRENLFVSGDTRIERVLDRKSSVAEFPKLKSFQNSAEFLFSLGSIWPEDEAAILDGCIDFLNANEGTKMILATHEIHEEHIQKLIKRFDSFEISYQRYTEGSNFENARILILDTVGILAETYNYVDAVFVGGSFKDSVHNVLEPAVYNLPIAVGPYHMNAQEALDLIELGTIFKIKNSEQMRLFLERVKSQEIDSISIKERNLSYFEDNKGASEKILEMLI